jgi:hypothetical protein
MFAGKRGSDRWGRTLRTPASPYVASHLFNNRTHIMRPIFQFIIFTCAVHSLFSFSLSEARDAASTGSIHGSVIDAESGQPLPGANIGIPGTERGAASDAQGQFTIAKLVPGTYRIRVTFIGYEPRIITDVVVRPGRSTEVVVRLHPSAVETGAVEITAGYFKSAAAGEVGIAEFSGEEIRRSPGSAGDVSRILMVLPSVAKVNDQSNSLIVRGGVRWKTPFSLTE